MKRLLSVCTLIASFVVSAAPQEGARNEKPFYGEERPARSIRIGTKPVVTLIPKQSNVEIVVASNAPMTTKYAADAMRNYLGKRLNMEIPIVHQINPEKTSLILGINEWSKKAGIDDKKLCRDAYIIQTVGKDVYILGRDDPKENLAANDKFGGVWGTLNEHATLFGVYEFLERFGGVRFYFPNELGIYIPENKPLEIPEINLFDRPDFEARNVSVYSGVWEDDKQKNTPFSATVSPQKNRYSKMLRLQTKYVPNCHGLRALDLIGRFSKSNPEYFALRSDGRRYSDPSMMFTGQLCYSSKVIDVIGDDAVALLRNQVPSSRGIRGKDWLPTEHLPGVVFGMMPQDAYQNCMCDACKKELATLQSTSNFMWRKTAEVARKVKKEVGRGYVSQMAYYPYHLVPEVEIPDNVLVMVAAKGPWSEADPQLLKTETERIRAWNKKLNRKTWLWNYVGKFGNLNMPGIPATSPRAIGKYYKSLKNDIYGAYMESEAEKMIYHYLNYYVFSKVAWNTDTDVDALLKEHYALMFGKVAPVMEKIMDGIEKTWVHQIGGRTVQTTLGPVGAPPSANELWTKLYSPERLREMTADFDRAQQLAAGDPKALARVRYIRREFLDPLVAAGENYRKLNNTIESFRIGMPAVLFLQPFRGNGAKSLTTLLRLSQDGNDLNLVFECEEPDMANAVAPKRDRDDPEIWKDNNVEIFLDPAGKRKGFYQLMINSSGALTDQYCKAIGSNTQADYRWDSNAEVKTSRTKNGWKAEVRIPMASLGTLNPEGFVANFTRNRVVSGVQQYSSWSPFLRLKFHELEHFGTIVPSELPERNILKNGDFDAPTHKYGIGSWIYPATLPEGVTVSQDNSTFVFGSKSLKMSNTNKKDKFVFAVTQAALAIKPNTKYRLSYFVRLENVVPLTSQGGICMNIWNTKNYWLPHNKLVGTLPWIKQCFEFTSAPGTIPAQTYIKPVIFQCTGTAWFDGVTLEEIR